MRARRTRLFWGQVCIGVAGKTDGGVAAAGAAPLDWPSVGTRRAAVGLSAQRSLSNEGGPASHRAARARALAAGCVGCCAVWIGGVCAQGPRGVWPRRCRCWPAAAVNPSKRCAIVFAVCVCVSAVCVVLVKRLPGGHGRSTAVKGQTPCLLAVPVSKCARTHTCVCVCACERAPGRLLTGRSQQGN